MGSGAGYFWEDEVRWIDVLSIRRSIKLEEILVRSVCVF